MLVSIEIIKAVLCIFVDMAKAFNSIDCNILRKSKKNRNCWSYTKTAHQLFAESRAIHFKRYISKNILWGWEGIQKKTRIVCFFNFEKRWYIMKMWICGKYCPIHIASWRRRGWEFNKCSLLEHLYVWWI